MNARLSSSPLARLQRLCGAWWRGQRPMDAFLQTVGAQGVILTANLLTGILTARLLGADGRGEYAAVSLWPQLVATLAMAGWSSATVYCMRSAPQRVSGIAAAALLGSWASTALCVAIVAALLPALLHHYSVAIVGFAQLCLVSAFVNVTHMSLKQTLAGAAAYGRANLTNVLPQLLYLPALLVLLPFGTLDARAAVLALLGSGAVALALLLPGWLRTVRPRVSRARSELAPLAGYAARAWLGELVFGLATFADRLVLVPLLRPAELGLYAVAYSFSRLVQLAQPAILSVFFSQLAGRTAAAAQQLHDRALRLLIVALAAGCAVLWMAGERLLEFAFGTEFIAANPIFRLLALEAALGVLSQVTVQLFLASNRPGFISVLQAVMLALSLGALMLVTPVYGALGAAAVLATVGLLRFLTLLFAATRVLGHAPPRLWLNIDDLRFIARRIP